jgi:hypothetical protein
MSDFDNALERLLTDPGFAQALAADPAAALAGYQLSEDERAVLTTQVADATGGQHAVEARTNQSSFAGLLNPFQSGGGGGGLMPDTVAPASDSAPAADRGFGAAPEPQTGFGAALPADRGFGAAPPTERGLGAAPDAQVGLGEAPAVRRALGEAPPAGGAAASMAESSDSPPQHGHGRGRPQPELPDGYRTRVDADGDGTWDEHRLLATPDGGVQIAVDLDQDGRVDFVGHDEDADGLVEWSAYDKDGDGKLETRMFDDNGDGWMDRTKPG